MSNLLRHACFTLPADVYLHEDNINISFCEMEWMVEVCLNRDNEEYPFAESSIYLCKDTPTTDTMYVKSRTCILLCTGAEKEAAEVHSCFNCQISSSNIWNLPTAILKHYLSSPECDRTFIRIELWFHEEEKRSLINELSGGLLRCSGTIDSGLQDLSADFNEILRNEFHADVVLHVGGLSLPAHKLVLSARSDVFKAMFRHDMSETATNTINIVDFDAETVETFLEYLYTGKFSKTALATTCDLYSIADKYAVAGLKKQCSLFLLSNMTCDNVCHTLKLADSHSDSNLKKMAMEYIAENSEILFTKKWRSLSDEMPKLAVEVYRLFVDKTARQKPLNVPVDINVQKEDRIRFGTSTEA